MPAPAILLIDDEPAIRGSCEIILSEKGYVLDSCPSGQQGLNRLEGEKYDILLLDLRLPDMDGMQILSLCKKKNPSLQVIILTGYPTVKNAVKAMKLGSFDYLTKPFSEDELIAAIDQALEHKQLHEENQNLRLQRKLQPDFYQLVGKHPKMMELFQKISRVAPTDCTVLIFGESGTGKELVARAIHQHSLRSQSKFVAVDCNTFSPSLLESELFGHIKGAFTDARQDKDGLFALADQGTLFLDEVSNLNLDIQAKLLRVMESGEYKPVGSNRIYKADIRILAATNKNLKFMVDQGKFREDLFYRLNVFPLFIPPLRERREDISILLYHFLKYYSDKFHKKLTGFSEEALKMLRNYSWPGNVRQLKNVVERLVILNDQSLLTAGNIYEHLEPFSETEQSRPIPDDLKGLKAAKQQLLMTQFAQIEQGFVLKALIAEQGNVTRAAQKVGMQRSNFSVLMKKHNISAEKIKQQFKNKVRNRNH